MQDKNISKDRKKYLQKQMKNKLLVVITQLSLLLGIIVLWEVLANAKIIDSFIMSQPSRIWDTLVNLSSNGLLNHIGITCFETIVGFVSGAVLGIIIAIILWWSPFISKVSEKMNATQNVLVLLFIPVTIFYALKGIFFNNDIEIMVLPVAFILKFGNLIILPSSSIAISNL